jgi:hypothetical protein
MEGLTMGVINKLEVGIRVYKVECSDGLDSPEYYVLSDQGTVKKLTTKQSNKSVTLGSMKIDEGLEDVFLRPYDNGLSKYIAELENIDQYASKNFPGFYHVPTDVLLKHTSTYQSPWS